MPYIALLFPAAFWTGVFLLRKPPDTEHKRRKNRLGDLKVIKESAPVKAIHSYQSKRRVERLEQELSESLSYVKNIAVLGRGENISAELLLSELAGFSKLLKPVFLDMAHDLHTNEKDRASEKLYQVLPKDYARDVGSFLASWEDIAPGDLISTIDVYSDMLRRARVTRLKQRDELISDLIYFPVVINCMAVLLNFIYIAYFIEQQDALMLLLK